MARKPKIQAGIEKALLSGCEKIASKKATSDYVRSISQLFNSYIKYLQGIGKPEKISKDNKAKFGNTDRYNSLKG